MIGAPQGQGYSIFVGAEVFFGELLHLCLDTCQSRLRAYLTGDENVFSL